MKIIKTKIPTKKAQHELAKRFTKFTPKTVQNQQ